MSAAQWFTRIQGRIQGPFSFDQLVTMKTRGRLNKIHEVSQDRQSWVRAGSIDGLFGAERSSSGGVATSAMEFAVAEPAPEGDQWYYAVAGNRLGPVPLSAVTQLISSGQLRPDDHVWKQDFPDWVPARHVPELHAALSAAPVFSTAGSSAATNSTPRKSSGAALWIGLGVGVCVLLLLAVGGAVAWRLRNASASGPNLGMPSLADSLQITSIEGRDNEARVKGGLGFVVCGARFTLYNGAVREEAFSTGTGFFVTSDGYMLTNKHVIEDIHKLLRANKLRKDLIETLKLESLEPVVWVFVGEQAYEAKIVYVSSNYDMAVLKLPRTGCHYFALSRTDELARNDKVLALGYPGAAGVPLSEWGVHQQKARKESATTIGNHFTPDDFVYSQKDGTVSAVRERKEDRTGRLIEHDAPLNPGNSGGPLVSRLGVVRGINTFGVTGAQGIFFAVSMPQLRKEIDQHAPGTQWVE